MAFTADWLRASYPGYVVEEQDLPWVLALFSRHPRFESKMDNWNGTVSCEFSHGNYHFAIHMHGEGWEDISYKKCLDNNAKPGGQDVFRTAVIDQVRSFKSKVFGQQFNVICSEIGEQLDSSSAYVDHVAVCGASFTALKMGFLATKNMKEEEVKSVPEKGSLLKDFADPVLREEWRAYHAKHAVLRLVSSKWSNGEGSRNRKT